MRKSIKTRAGGNVIKIKLPETWVKCPLCKEEYIHLLSSGICGNCDWEETKRRQEERRQHERRRLENERRKASARIKSEMFPRDDMGEWL